MRIAILGTGSVGQTLGTAFAAAGHDVVIGTRDPDATRAREGWGTDLPLATYDEAAAPAEVVVTAVSGTVAREVLGSAGDLAGKVVLDVSNPLDGSQGFRRSPWPTPTAWPSSCSGPSPTPASSRR